MRDPSQCQEPEPVRPARSFTGSTRSGKLHSEPNSAQSTPARSSSRISLGGGSNRGGLGRGVKGIEFSTEVSHFELKNDPSFWTDHSVQVLIRIRPLSNAEKLSQGHGRCLRQESAQTLVWLGHPETRFTFDHIGCETLSQENLFRVAGVPMVENCLSGYNSCMFAHGQTGSGKTYTMMGEIKETLGCLAEDSGITSRVFDYLFTRIKTEEESSKDYKLKYTCKCSFLEIYNEQITDLLEPSSTNLEDMKKGVYFENLTEHSVVMINDVPRLLIQGAANRRVVATHMNCESSRSHSVFTCINESQWEEDSMTHFRFTRLNLVDLAGSERSSQYWILIHRFLHHCLFGVWHGQPNEEDDRSKKMQRNIHTSNKNKEENHMVGWPPIKSWRKKELHQQQHPAGGHIRNDRMQANENQSRGSKPLYVKVHMEGVAIGRQVNLRLYNSYQALTDSLISMFVKNQKFEEDRASYTLSFQNKQGNWLLTRRVPWQSFIGTVRRLAILRNGI